ncbi:hypothetical protein RRF57_010766 [Xylaria bambusicola]|uniref:Uncharacterized protein n=1 Tax=Xylaria bambusicola TaxID=326684 RepID=A0AAN7UT00_9PEZI
MASDGKLGSLRALATRVSAMTKLAQAFLTSSLNWYIFLKGIPSRTGWLASSERGAGWIMPNKAAGPASSGTFGGDDMTSNN